MAQPDAIQKEPWAGSLIGTEKRPHPPTLWAIAETLAPSVQVLQSRSFRMKRSCGKGRLLNAGRDGNLDNADGEHMHDGSVLLGICLGEV